MVAPAFLGHRLHHQMHLSDMQCMEMEAAIRLLVSKVMQNHIFVFENHIVSGFGRTLCRLC